MSSGCLAFPKGVSVPGRGQGTAELERTQAHHCHHEHLPSVSTKVFVDTLNVFLTAAEESCSGSIHIPALPGADPPSPAGILPCLLQATSPGSCPCPTCTVLGCWPAPPGTLLGGKSLPGRHRGRHSGTQPGLAAGTPMGCGGTARAHPLPTQTLLRQALADSCHKQSISSVKSNKQTERRLKLIN